MQTIDKVIDEISEFSIEEQEIIADVINKRITDEKRELIYNDYIKALENYNNGDVETGSVDDLFKAIEQ